MTERLRVSEETVRCARAFLDSLQHDFAMQGHESPIVAGWNTAGLLLIAAQGWKASRLDAMLRDEGLAVPDGRQRTDT